MPRFAPMIRTGVICACVLLGMGVAFASYRTFLYPGEAQELKQESEQKSLHDAPIKIYLDYRKAPALLEIRIRQLPHPASGSDKAPDVRYADLKVKVFDERGGTIPLWRGWATSDWTTSEFVPGIRTNSSVNPGETIRIAVYLLQVVGDRHAAWVDLEWSGQKETFPVFASNHSFGYRLAE